MKKTLLLLAVAAVCFMSCKKDNSAPKAIVKKYKVTFNVTNLHTAIKAFAVRHNSRNLASGDTLSNSNPGFNVLSFSVFDGQNRSTVIDVIQDSTNVNMGTLIDSLPAGIYRVTTVAGKNGLGVDADFFNTNSFGYNGNPWQDTFYNSFYLTVGDADIGGEITLQRVVAKLEVTIKDNIPANAENLIVSTDMDAGYIDLWQGVFVPYFDPYQSDNFVIPISASAKGKPNFTIDRIIGNCSTIPITITCTGPGNTVIATTTVNANFSANVKTILSGNLFQGIGNNSQTFTARIDTAWGPTVSQLYIGH